MSMLLISLTLVLDWLDAVGSAIALVALLDPRLRSQGGLLLGWAAGLLANRRAELDRFLAAARAGPPAETPSRARDPRQRSTLKGIPGRK